MTSGNSKGRRSRALASVLSIVCGLALMQASPAGAATAGPAWAVQATSTGWTSPAAATGASDGSCAQAGANATIDVSGFGLSIPQGATVTAIAVESKFARSVTSGGGTQAKIQMTKSGTAVGAAKDLAGGAQATCAATALQASSVDLWGATWTPSDIAGLGVRITTGTSTSATWRLDALRVSVIFTPDATAPSVTLSSPVTDSLTNDSTPTISGVAGTSPGDAQSVAVTIYEGTDTSGAIVELLSAARDLNTGAFSVDAAGLADGSYTVQASQSDDSGNAGSSAPSTFAVDATAPTTAIDLAVGQSALTNSSPAVFEVTFSESVTGFDASDVVVDGTAGTAAATVVGSGADYEVSVPLTADGTVSISVAQDAGADAANNGSAGAVGPVVTYDATAPEVSSIQRASDELTNDPAVEFLVTFSEPVGGVSAEQFAVAASGSISGASVQDVAGSGSSYTVTVGTGAGDGTLRLDLPASAAITDAAGNAVAAAFTAGESYVIDKTAPTTTIDELVKHEQVEAGVALSAPVTGRSSECGATTTVRFVDLLNQTTTDVVATLGACDAGVQSWSASAPGQGAFEVTATSTDAVGNMGPASETVLIAAA